MSIEMKNKHRAFYITIFLYFAFFQSVILAAETDRVSLKKIKFLPDDAHIVTEKMLDHLSCNVAQNKGETILINDFNGDGKKDYAILVSGNIKDETIIWAGKKYHEVEMWLVVILYYLSASPKAINLSTWPALSPIGAYIKLVGPGNYKDRLSGRIHLVNKNSISLVYCEKSEILFYWERGKFIEIAIAD